jgi:Secretion system C-terminal sorting domain
VGQTSTACVLINQSSDDAEQRSNGSINLTSSTLEIVEDGSDHQIIGLRFNNLNIPRGAAIASSFLNFKVKSDSNKNPCVLSITGQTDNNTLTFAGSNNNLSIRPRTNTSMTWSPGNWTQTNSTQSTVDIGAIIQEVVLQDAYTPTQSIILFIEGEGRRNAITFDQGSGSSAPELCITFDPVNCLDKDFDGTCDVDDVCLNGPEPGQNCNDNNPSTFDDKVNSNCVCIGTLYDCVNLNAQFGSPCNDNNSGTFNDIVTLNCECKGIPYDCPILQVQFGSTCNDNNPGTFNDIITTSCTCAGTPYDCPALQVQFGSPCNDNNPFTCQDVIGTNCLCAGTPTNSLFTKNSRVDQNSDDAEQRSDGSVSISSDDLELIRDASNQIVGLRFDNPGIAPGTILSSAFIHFTVDETNNTNPCNLTIYGEKNISSATFSTSNNNISTRVKTSSSASWSPGTWSAVGDNGLAQRSTDIAPVLQEIINLNGYTANTPFTIIIEGVGRRVAVAHDKSAINAPLLSVSYQINLPDSDGDGVCNADDQCVGPEPVSPCNDANPQTFDDEVNLNCICVGKPYGCPTLLANVGDVCNDFNPQTYNDVVTENCICQGSPIVQSSLCVPISNSADDSEQKSNGTCSITSSDLELAKDNGDTQLIGLRFRNLDLQQGTIIGDSYLQFTVDKSNNVNPCVLTIRGELNSNPAVFNITNNNIGNRPLTAASVQWSPQQWPVNGAAGIAQRTPNIQSIIQEIVNQSGFNENSALALIITGEGLRQAVAYDGNSNNAAELCMNIFAPPTTQSLVVSKNGTTSEGRLSAPNMQEEIAVVAPSSTANNTITTSYLKVYPNPAQNSLTASFDVLEKGLVQINVLDMNGQLLTQVQSDASSGQNQVSLNLADLPNGLYFLSLQTDSERRVAKFSVLR